MGCFVGGFRSVAGGADGLQVAHAVVVAAVDVVDFEVVVAASGAVADLAGAVVASDDFGAELLPSGGETCGTVGSGPGFACVFGAR